MSLLFGKSCQYAIQATVLLALQPADKLLLITEIASHLDIPSPYLAKVLQILSKRGLLTSVKGPGGGFKLGMPAESIIIRDIVESTDGLAAFDKCLLGFPKCGEQNLCPVHETWAGIKTDIMDNILSKSIAELLVMLKNKTPEGIEELLYC
jgi:Rrf2 family transcriptional regulator, iron-sulfur cluster assembly transcription factor